MFFVAPLEESTRALSSSNTFSGAGHQEADIRVSLTLVPRGDETLSRDGVSRDASALCSEDAGGNTAVEFTYR